MVLLFLQNSQLQRSTLQLRHWLKWHSSFPSLFNHFTLLIFLTFSTITVASPGDDLYAFLDCLYQCEQLTCYNNPYHILQRELIQNTHPTRRYTIEQNYYNPNWQFDAMPLPLHLRLLGWSCISNCDYQCQRVITMERRKHDDEETLQFHGKWPFWRIYGIQELGSAITSLGNFYVNYKYGFLRICDRLKAPLAYEHKLLYVNILVVTIITMLAWTASTIFHIRDFKLTEHMDYYLAGATVLSQFHALVARVLALYREDRKLYRRVFAAACILAYVGHVWRLVTDWSYTYNMRANITVGIGQNLAYCALVYLLYSKYYWLEKDQLEPKQLESEQAPATVGETITLNGCANQCHLKYIDFKRIILPSFYSRSAKLYSLYPILLCTIVICGMLLEIFDFPPVCYDLIDAHCLWHFVTIWPAYYGFYDWLVWDVDEHAWSEVKESLQAAKRKKL